MIHVYATRGEYDITGRWVLGRISVLKPIVVLGVSSNVFVITVQICVFKTRVKKRNNATRRPLCLNTYLRS